MSEQRRPRARVLRARVPRSPRQLGRAEEIAVALVEGVEHAAHRKPHSNCINFRPGSPEFDPIRSAGAAPELLGPDVGAAVAFEPARLQTDPGAFVGTEDVFPVALRVHPGPEDGSRRAETAAPPGD